MKKKNLKSKFIRLYKHLTEFNTLITSSIMIFFLSLNLVSGQNCQNCPDTSWKIIRINGKIKHEVRFVKSINDSIWLYQIKTNPNHGVKHGIFEFKCCAKVVEMGTWQNNGTVLTPLPLAQNNNGIKFNDYIPEDTIVNYYLRTEKRFSSTNNMELTLKDGNKKGSGSTTLCGPDCDNVLPVILTSFVAFTNRNDNSILLTWSTASEINNDKFIVQKSTNGIDWINITEVKGFGNSYTKKIYEYSDRNDYINSMKYVYYRLKQVDFDGHFEYSEIVKITNKTDKVDKIWVDNLYNNISIKYLSDKNANISVSVIDISGNSLMVRNFNSTIGENYFNISVIDFKNGIYTVMINVNNYEVIKYHRIKI
jgi:hypothetical protein